MSGLGLTVTAKGRLIGLSGESERIEESHGSEGAGHAVDVEGAHCGGGHGNWCGCECGGGADESGGEDNLHHDVGVMGGGIMSNLCSSDVSCAVYPYKRRVVSYHMKRTRTCTSRQI